jgi:hypothetical protein
MTPIALKARAFTYFAIKYGYIIRPKLCEECGLEKKLDAHHENYERENWLRVKWLCRKCHNKKRYTIPVFV